MPARARCGTQRTTRRQPDPCAAGTARDPGDLSLDRPLCLSAAQCPRERWTRASGAPHEQGLLRRRSMQPHFERIWLPLAQGTARRRRTRRRANSIRFRTASPATLPLRASSRCSSAGEQAGLAGLNVVVSARSAELKARRWDPPSSRKSSTHDGLSCNVRMRNEHLVLQE